MLGLHCNIGWPKAYAHLMIKTPRNSPKNGQTVNNDLLYFFFFHFKMTLYFPGWTLSNYIAYKETKAMFEKVISLIYFIA